MKNEENFELLKPIAKEMGGNGINATVEEIDIADLLKNFETV